MVESRESMAVPVLKDLLIATARGSDLLLPGSPESIQLGTIAPECDRLMQLTYADPQHQEKAAMLYVLPDGKLIIDAKETSSATVQNGMRTVLHTFIRSRGPQVPRHLRQDKYTVGALHTHGLKDAPQSTSDLIGLFRKVDETNAAMLNAVITPNRKIFIFRGANTPQWEEDFIQSKVQIWRDAFLQRVGHHLRSSMSHFEVDEINRRASTALINQIAQKYDLAIYSCSTSETVLKKGPVA